MGLSFDPGVKGLSGSPGEGSVRGCPAPGRNRGGRRPGSSSSSSSSRLPAPAPALSRPRPAATRPHRPPPRAGGREPGRAGMAPLLLLLLVATSRAALAGRVLTRCAGHLPPGCPAGTAGSGAPGSPPRCNGPLLPWGGRTSLAARLRGRGRGQGRAGAGPGPRPPPAVSCLWRCRRPGARRGRAGLESASAPQAPGTPG